MMNFGTTIILAEHKLDDLFTMANKFVLMNDGRIVNTGNVNETLEFVKKENSFATLMPEIAKIGLKTNSSKNLITVKDGRRYLKEKTKDTKILPKASKPDAMKNEIILSLKDVWFRYEKNSKDILKGINLEVKKGEIYGILGGNGTGKTTLLSVMCKVLKSYNGKINIKEKISMLPQNPEYLFTKDTVLLDLKDICKDENKLNELVKLLEIKELLGNHPLDLSGGEQERVAIAKVLLTEPEIILMDEPTKGMDGIFKEKFIKLLKELKSKGKTIIIVSHDMEFCAEVCDRCALFFDGQIISENSSKDFFENNKFYTTVIKRMTNNIIPVIVKAGELVEIIK